MIYAIIIFCVFIFAVIAEVYLLFFCHDDTVVNVDNNQGVESIHDVNENLMNLVKYLKEEDFPAPGSGLLPRVRNIYDNVGDIKTSIDNQKGTQDKINELSSSIPISNLQDLIDLISYLSDIVNGGNSNNPSLKMFLGELKRYSEELKNYSEGERLRQKMTGKGVPLDFLENCDGVYSILSNLIDKETDLSKVNWTQTLELLINRGNEALSDKQRLNTTIQELNKKIQELNITIVGLKNNISSQQIELEKKDKSLSQKDKDICDLQKNNVEELNKYKQKMEAFFSKDICELFGVSLDNLSEVNVKKRMLVCSYLTLLLGDLRPNNFPKRFSSFDSDLLSTYGDAELVELRERIEEHLNRKLQEEGLQVKWARFNEQYNPKFHVSAESSGQLISRALSATIFQIKENERTVLLKGSVITR